MKIDKDQLLTTIVGCAIAIGIITIIAGLVNNAIGTNFETEHFNGVKGGSRRELTEKEKCVNAGGSWCRDAFGNWVCDLRSAK